MLNAYFEGPVLYITCNGCRVFQQDYGFYTDHQAVVSGNTVYANMVAPGNSRTCFAFDFNESGNLVNMRQESV